MSFTTDDTIIQLLVKFGFIATIARYLYLQYCYCYFWA